MRRRLVPLPKMTRPRQSGVLPRPRLYRALDGSRTQRVVWVTGPPGAGKTTLLASYLEARKRRGLWYQLDEGDGDVATFFYLVGLAMARASPRRTRPLPLFTPEYRASLATFARRYFAALYARLRPPFAVVFDNYQDVPADSAFHEVMREGLGAIPEGGRAFVLSRAGPPPGLARLRASGVLSVARRASSWGRSATR